MNRLVTNRSRTALSWLWLLIAATCADAANIDDFLGSVTVLHDDQDVASAASQQLPPRQDLPAPGAAHKPVGPPVIVIDQDSPSLEASLSASALVAESVAAPGQVALVGLQLPCESLHIKLRTLII